MVLFIPFIILVALSGYTIYQTELNSKPERVEMQDGSGDILLTKRSELMAFKLPNEVGEIKDIIGDDMKVTSYNVYFDRDNNIKSAFVTIKADDSGAQDKYNLEEGLFGYGGNVEGYDMELHYDKYNQRLDIDLKKNS